MDFELSLLPVAASMAAGLACYVIYRRLVGSRPTHEKTVLFADESYDDWRSVLSLDSWEAFDAYFQAKYIDTEVFAGGATVVISDKQGVVHRRVFGDHKEDSVYCAYSVTKNTEMMRGDSRPPLTLDKDQGVVQYYYPKRNWGNVEWKLGDANVEALLEVVDLVST